MEATTPLELALGTGLELLLEFSTKYITLGPLYSLTQPLAVLKTRAFYRMVQVRLAVSRQTGFCFPLSHTRCDTRERVRESVWVFSAQHTVCV